MGSKGAKSKKRAADDLGEGSSKTKKAKPATTASEPVTEEARKKKEAKDAAERTKKVEASSKKNPHHVFVIGPPYNAWEDNSKKLAGYLNFHGRLEDFRIFLNGDADSQESKDVAEMLTKYLAVRNANFGKPDSSLSRGKPGLTISAKQLFATIDDTSSDITQLFQSDVTLPLPIKEENDEETCWKVGTTRYALATTIKAMAYLIAHSPTMFPASHLSEDQRLHPMGVTRYTAEDWHRAYQLLRFCFRQHSDIKKATNFFTHDQSEKGNGEEALFFTADELDQANDTNQHELGLADGDEEGRVVAALFHMAQASASTTQSATDSSPAATMPDLDADPAYWVKHQKDFEDSVEQADKRVRAGNDLGSGGIHVRRGRLDKANMRMLCRALGEECKIIHDDATIMTQSGTTVTKANFDSGALDQSQVC